MSGINQMLKYTAVVALTAISSAFAAYKYIQNDIDEGDDRRDATLQMSVQTVADSVAALATVVEKQSGEISSIRSAIGVSGGDVRVLFESQSNLLELIRESARRNEAFESYAREKISQLSDLVTANREATSIHQHSGLEAELRDLERGLNQEIVQRRLLEQNVASLDRLLNETRILIDRATNTGT